MDKKIKLNEKDLIMDFLKIREDDRLFPNESMVYLVLLIRWCRSGRTDWISISNHDLLKYSGINSYSALQSARTHLVERGYIKYKLSSGWEITYGKRRPQYHVNLNSVPILGHMRFFPENK